MFLSLNIRSRGCVITYSLQPSISVKSFFNNSVYFLVLGSPIAHIFLIPTQHLKFLLLLSVFVNHSQRRSSMDSFYGLCSLSSICTTKEIMYIFFSQKFIWRRLLRHLYLEENANSLDCTGFSLSVIKLTLVAIAIQCIKFTCMCYYQPSNRVWVKYERNYERQIVLQDTSKFFLYRSVLTGRLTFNSLLS